MKKSLLSLAVLSAVSFGAYADGVELYGILDAAAVNVAHQPSNGANSGVNVDVNDLIKNSSTTQLNSLQGLVNGGISASRFGIKGSETLEPGLKAIFTLESCLNITDGVTCNNAADMANGTTANPTNIHASSLDGQLFGRQAWVGLQSDDLGSLRLGRVYSLVSDVFADMGYAPVKNAQQFSPIGYSGTLGGGGGMTEKTRLDNAISYKVKSGNFNFGLNYAFGNVAGSSSEGSTTNIGAGYEDDKFGVQAVYTYITDGAAGSALNGTPSTLTIAGSVSGLSQGVLVTYENVSSYLFAMKYKINDQVTLKAGLQQFEYTAPSDLGLAVACPAYYSVATASTECTNLTVGNAFNRHLYHIGVDYQITDKWYLGLGATNLVNDKTASSATDNSTNNTSYSVLLDYSFTKRTDAYLGGMFMTSGGQGLTGANSLANNSIVGVGLRTKF